MGRRFKLSKTKAREFARRMSEQEAEHNFIDSNGPLREGCYVKFVRKSDGSIISGIIETSSYGAKRGQHTFNINGVLVKGRNLYDRLLEHIPGEISKRDKK